MSTDSYTEFVLISYPIQWFWGISHQYAYISINKTAINGLRFWNSIQVRRRVIGCKKASSHHSHILSAQFPPYCLLIYTSPTYQVNLLIETEENILTRKTLWLRILPPKLWATSKKMLKPRCHIFIKLCTDGVSHPSKLNKGFCEINIVTWLSMQLWSLLICLLTRLLNVPPQWNCLFTWWTIKPT